MLLTSVANIFRCHHLLQTLAADICVQGADGKSLLMAAVEGRQEDFVAALLQAGAGASVYSQVPCHLLTCQVPVCHRTL